MKTRYFKDLKGKTYEFLGFEEKAIDSLRYATHIDHCMHAKGLDEKGDIHYIRAMDIEFI